MSTISDIFNKPSTRIPYQQGIKNATEGKKFLEENKQKPGVVTTESGLHYKVINKGSGSKPKSTDEVEVNYRGTLLNGLEFDSSYQREKPAKFKLDQVIAGWTEGLQLMSKGSKFEFYIPPELAYGRTGTTGKIGPNATLVFEVELLDIN
jgi:FKBP-type peptidyl-prolyl cis-trans isomerase FkpA